VPQHEPFDQWDMPLPGIPGLTVVLVKVGGHLAGTYVVMSPLCEQLGEIDASSQVAKLRGDHDFDGMLRDVPYRRTPQAGLRTAVGVRRYKAGDWIRGINPKKTRPEYRERLEEIGRLVTGFTDRTVFGAVASHLDPAPGSSVGASVDCCATEVVTSAPTVSFRGEFEFTCEHGTKYLIILDETGAPRVVRGREVGQD
jgi:hypothetical protein